MNWFLNIVQHGYRHARRRMYLHDRSSGSTKPKEKDNYCRWRRNTTKFLKTAAKMKKNVIHTVGPKGRELNFSHQPRTRHALSRSSSAAGPRRHSRAPTTASPRFHSTYTIIVTSSSNLLDVLYFNILHTYNL